jgi:predicted GH43/DUF377 family glycosyl hydrolase
MLKNLSTADCELGIVMMKMRDPANRKLKVTAVLMIAGLFGFIHRLSGQAAPATSQPSLLMAPVPIDIAHAPAPLFDDQAFHGASDPVVIWNPFKGLWYMYYTQRRASMRGGTGVDWVHGSSIGIAASKDGSDWQYLGTCQGDHDLSEPLKASGLGPEPGVTWWAPCLVFQDGVLHLFVTEVDGVYPDWKGNRNIVHYTSVDGSHWQFASVCKLASQRVIDPTVYRVNNTWYMVYKNEAAGSNTFRSQSDNLIDWTDAAQITHDGAEEAPMTFRWRNQWWLIVDAISKKGLRIYKSPDGIDHWQYVSTVLGNADGVRPFDQGVGHHPGIVVQGPPGDEQCLIFYFTQRGRRSAIQLAQLELTADGTVTCNRNKYAAPTIRK